MQMVNKTITANVPPPSSQATHHHQQEHTNNYIERTRNAKGDGRALPH
jgi:hypothetical protein